MPADRAQQNLEYGAGDAHVVVEVRTQPLGDRPAFNADFKAAVVGRFLPVVLLVIGATLVTLMIGFRSVLIPLKAVVLNLLSVAGAFGALVLVFQDGLGIRLLGLSSVPGSVFAMVPVLVFCVVFGLSMDYEVFLVARVAEARRLRDESEAVIEGLAQTGHVITSAAAIMVVVFGGFTLGDFVLMKMLGVRAGHGGAAGRGDRARSDRACPARPPGSVELVAGRRRAGQALRRPRRRNGT